MILNAGSGGSSGGLKVIACGSFTGGLRQPIHPAGSGSVCAGRGVFSRLNGWCADLWDHSNPHSWDACVRYVTNCDLRDRRSDAYHGEHDGQHSNSQLYCVRLTLAQEGQEGGAA